jgi:hypothetical protein
LMLCAGNLPQVGSEQGRHRATVWPHYTQVPVQRIEETIRPTPQQRGVFEALKTASSKAADGLRSSCPAQMPTKMVDRLDSVDARSQPCYPRLRSCVQRWKNFMRRSPMNKRPGSTPGESRKGRTGQFRSDRADGHHFSGCEGWRKPQCGCDHELTPDGNGANCVMAAAPG